MEYEGPNTEQRLLQELEETLESLPDARHVRSKKHGGRGYDAEITFDLAGHPVRVLVECKRTAYPRDVRDLLPLWEELSAQKRATPLLAAESISVPMRDDLRQRRVGYFDMGGSLYLPLPAGGYVLVDRPPPTRIVGRSDVFEGKTLRIVHHLLVDPGEWQRVTEIARLCGVAPSTASRTMAELEREGWVEARGSGPYKERRAVQPGAMLDAWVNNARARADRPFTRYFVPGASSADGVVRRIAEAFKNRSKYAITHQAGSQLIAPWLTGVSQVRLRALAVKDTQDALAELRAQPVEEGSNMALLEVEDPLDIFLGESRGGVMLATPVQIYVDLLQSGEGRSKEAADNLRKESLQY